MSLFKWLHVEKKNSFQKSVVIALIILKTWVDKFPCENPESFCPLIKPSSLSPCGLQRPKFEPGGEMN